MATLWIAVDPRFRPDHLGFLTEIFDAQDPRPARQQADERYAYGGGWSPQVKWEINTVSGLAKYPGDPAVMPIAKCHLDNGETLLLYPHAYVCVIAPDGVSYSMARMD